MLTFAEVAIPTFPGSGAPFPDLHVVHIHEGRVGGILDGEATAQSEVEEDVFGPPMFDGSGDTPDLAPIEVDADEVFLDTYAIGVEVGRKGAGRHFGALVRADVLRALAPVPEVNGAGEPSGIVAVMFDDVDLGRIVLFPADQPEGGPDTRPRRKFRTHLKISEGLQEPSILHVHGCEEARLPSIAAVVPGFDPQNSVTHRKWKIRTRIGELGVPEIPVPRRVRNPARAGTSRRHVEPIKLFIEGERVAGKVDSSSFVGCVEDLWVYRQQRCRPNDQVTREVLKLYRVIGFPPVEKVLVEVKSASKGEFQARKRFR